MKALAKYAQIGSAAQILDEVFAERQHQIKDNDYTPERDDRFALGQLRDGAIACALADRRCSRDRTACEEFWCFDGEAKDKGYRQNLLQAAAMLVAEIERLDRLPVIGGGA